MRAGNTRNNCVRIFPLTGDQGIGAPPSPRKHGLELGLWDAQSLGSEPRWNADRRAHPAGCAAVPAARQVGQCVCRRSASFIFCLAKWAWRTGNRRHHPFFSVGHCLLRASTVAAIAKLGRGCAARTRSLIRPRDSGGGGPRSCAVEGASDSSLRRRRKSGVESDAPSTTLRVVPLPRFRGAGRKGACHEASLGSRDGS